MKQLSALELQYNIHICNYLLLKELCAKIYFIKEVGISRIVAKLPFRAL